jgi:hypothetical protein
MGTLNAVWNQFGDRLFLARDELEAYVGKRINNQMAILVLKAARKYSTPLRLPYPLTMAGQYMTKELYQRLTQMETNRG